MSPQADTAKAALTALLGGEWSCVAEERPPADGTGHGRGPGVDFDTWAAGTNRAPLAAIDIAGVRVYRDRAAPSFVELRARDVVEVRSGRHALRDDMLVLAPGAGAADAVAVVDLRSLDGDVRMLTLTGDHVAVWTQAPTGAEFDEPALTALPAPAVVEWLGTGAPGWLLDHARALAASPGAVDRAEAAGCVLRYAPTDHPQGELAFDSARAWCATALPPGLSAIEGACVSRALSLAESLAATLGERHAARDALPGIVNSRDDLQSAWVALRVVGGGAGLWEALQTVDERAARHATALGDAWSVLEPPLTQRLTELSWREPESWWASRP